MVYIWVNLLENSKASKDALLQKGDFIAGITFAMFVDVFRIFFYCDICFGTSKLLQEIQIVANEIIKALICFRKLLEKRIIVDASLTLANELVAIHQTKFPIP